jgi:hypothetical protein
MKHRTILVAGALVAMSMGTAALAVPAVAAPNTPVIVSCLSLKGTITGSSLATGCNQTTLTGGSGTFSAPKPPAFGIKWKNGKTSTGTESYVSVPNTCPTGFTTEVKTTVTIKGGTDTKLVGGKGVDYICIGGTKIESKPGTKFVV